jgi:hypothetical protein
MRIQTLPAFLLLVASLVGCGGGGGSGQTPTPPPPSQALSITLVSTGSMPGFFASAVPSGLALINSLAEYDALYFGLAGPQKPLDLRTLDFAQNSIFYVEGPADDFLGATARLREIRRTSGTQDSVSAERCTNDAAGIPTPSRAHRPYAFYIVPKLMAGVTYAWSTALSPGCSTVEMVSPLTRAGVGDFGAAFGRPQPPYEFRAIRSQAELDAVLPSFPLGEIPPQYRAPDFSQVTLLFVAGFGDNDPNSYVRVDRVYTNDDGSRDVIVEYCGHSSVSIPTHIPFALYVVPRFTEAARMVRIERVPGACALPR